jgi:hypothetical protein
MKNQKKKNVRNKINIKQEEEKYYIYLDIDKKK